jgi:hypothetical protein
MASNQGSDGVRMSGIAAQAAIGQAQVLAPCSPEDLTRRLRLFQPILDGAVTTHLPGGQIAQPNRQTHGRMAGNDAASADFDVVWMWPEDEEVNAHSA